MGRTEDLTPKAFSPKASRIFLSAAGRGAVKGASPGGRAVFSPYELRSVARTGAGVPEARPEGSEGPLTAGPPPPPTLVGGEALGGLAGVSGERSSLFGYGR